MKLHVLDLAIIGLYLIATVFVGFWVSKRASRNMKSYFLGGNKLPWYMPGVSNASGMFDISGTMWLVYMFIWLRDKWHDTADIHFLSIKDFEEFCREKELRIRRRIAAFPASTRNSERMDTFASGAVSRRARTSMFIHVFNDVTGSR